MIGGSRRSRSSLPCKARHSGTRCRERVVAAPRFVAAGRVLPGTTPDDIPRACFQYDVVGSDELLTVLGNGQAVRGLSRPAPRARHRNQTSRHFVLFGASGELGVKIGELCFRLRQCGDIAAIIPLTRVRRGDDLLDRFLGRPSMPCHDRYDPRGSDQASAVTRPANLSTSVLRVAVCLYRDDACSLSSFDDAPDAVVSDAADRMQDLTDRLADKDIPIWVFDASPSGADQPSVIKAIAPGLEGETMSYYRIGARGALRLLERGSPLVHREDGKGRAQIRMPARAQIRMPARAEAHGNGPFWLDTAEVDRIVGPLYPLYREPSSHALRFAGVE